MATGIYSSARWRETRAQALARDSNRCTVARLLGGACSGLLHVHHIEPVEEGGDAFDLSNCATVCAIHHSRWHAVRRAVLASRRREQVRCPHYHRTRAGREECERRLAREREAA